MRKRKILIYKQLLIELKKVQLNDYLSKQVEKQFEPIAFGTPKVKKLGVWKKL